MRPPPHIRGFFQEQLFQILPVVNFIHPSIHPSIHSLFVFYVVNCFDMHVYAYKSPPPQVGGFFFFSRSTKTIFFYRSTKTGSIAFLFSTL